MNETYARFSQIGSWNPRDFWWKFRKICETITYSCTKDLFWLWKIRGATQMCHELTSSTHVDSWKNLCLFLWGTFTDLISPKEPRLFKEKNTHFQKAVWQKKSARLKEKKEVDASHKMVDWNLNMSTWKDGMFQDSRLFFQRCLNISTPSTDGFLRGFLFFPLGPTESHSHRVTSPNSATATKLVNARNAITGAEISLAASDAATSRNVVNLFSGVFFGAKDRCVFSTFWWWNLTGRGCIPDLALGNVHVISHVIWHTLVHTLPTKTI